MQWLSDLAKLSESLRTTWAKSQSDVSAHALLLLVVFVLCGATVPSIALPVVDPAEIMENPWFRLGKETGTLYLLVLVPPAALLAYVAILRRLGQWAGGILIIVFQPRNWGSNVAGLLNVDLLEPLALSLNVDDFSIADLLGHASRIGTVLATRKGERWEAYQKSLQSSFNVVSKNIFTYVQDFSAFLVGWICLFALAPHSSWVRQNELVYWKVVALLLLLIAAALFRALRMLQMMPGLTLVSIATIVRAEPEIAPIVDNSDARRSRIRAKLEALLEEERHPRRRNPSLARYVRSRMGGQQTPAQRDDRRAGWPFPALYERGFQFLYGNGHERYDSDWLGGYLAYLYYCLHERVTSLVRMLGTLARYFVLGRL